MNKVLEFIKRRRVIASIVTLVGILLAITTGIQSEEIYRIVKETKTYLVDKKEQAKRIFNEEKEIEIISKLDELDIKVIELKEEIQKEKIIVLPAYNDNPDLRLKYQNARTEHDLGNKDKQHYLNSISILEEIISDPLDHNDNGYSYYWIGENYHKLGKYELAINAFNTVLNIYKYAVYPEKKITAMYLKAACYDSLNTINSRAMAKQIIQELEEKYKVYKNNGYYSHIFKKN